MRKRGCVKKEPANSVLMLSTKERDMKSKKEQLIGALAMIMKIDANIMRENVHPQPRAVVMETIIAIIMTITISLLDRGAIIVAQTAAIIMHEGTRTIMRVITTTTTMLILTAVPASFKKAVEAAG